MDAGVGKDVPGFLDQEQSSRHTSEEGSWLCTRYSNNEVIMGRASHLTSRNVPFCLTPFPPTEIREDLQLKPIPPMCQGAEHSVSALRRPALCRKVLNRARVACIADPRAWKSTSPPNMGSIQSPAARRGTPSSQHCRLFTRSSFTRSKCQWKAAYAGAERSVNCLAATLSLL